MDYISAYAEDFLRVAGIRCRMDLPVALPAVRVEAELRYNLFLALKEALNNVVKHAQATEVWLRLRIEAENFHAGRRGQRPGPAGRRTAARRSLDADRIASGSGLANLEKRLAAVGGRCDIHSRPGHGTRVEMTVALKPGGIASCGDWPDDDAGLDSAMTRAIQNVPATHATRTSSEEFCALT